jgi:integrase
MSTRSRNLPNLLGKEPQEAAGDNPSSVHRRRSPRHRRLATRQASVVTSIALPQPLHEQLKIAAVRFNWSLAAVLHDASAYWLARHMATLDRAARNDGRRPAMKIFERVRYGARGEGALIRREGVATWCYSYCHRGKEHEESTKTTDLKVAKRFAKHKRDEMAVDRMGKGTYQPATAAKIRVGELLDDLEVDYRLRKVKSLVQIQSHMKPIRAYFGDERAADVTASAVDSYIEACLEDEMAPATINRRTQVLSQAFRLGMKHGRVTTIPWIRHLPERNVRQGFFEAAEFAAVVAALPDAVQDFARFGYLTGWRSGEIKALRWEWVDREGDLIRLPGSNSKNGRSRKVPIEGELRDVMRRREQARLIEVDGDVRITEVVFHRDGEPIVDIRKA